MPYTFVVNVVGTSDKIVIDRNNLPSTVPYKLFFKIKNQSLVTLYFRVLVNIDGWTLTEPSDGHLGSVDSGKETLFSIVMERSKPSSDLEESGTIEIQAFTDSGYTNYIGSQSFNVTVIFVDVEGMDEVTMFDFNDGTKQGWETDGRTDVYDGKAVEAGGYCLRHYRTQVQFDVEGYLSYAGLELPDRNRVYLSLYWTYWVYNEYCKLYYLRTKVNGDVVHELLFPPLIGPASTDVWLKLGIDISQYRGQKVNLMIEFKNYAQALGYVVELCFDRIVIGGSD